jgi:hypothetical protein
MDDKKNLTVPQQSHIKTSPLLSRVRRQSVEAERFVREENLRPMLSNLPTRSRLKKLDDHQ